MKSPSKEVDSKTKKNLFGLEDETTSDGCSLFDTSLNFMDGDNELLNIIPTNKVTFMNIGEPYSPVSDTYY